MENRKTPKLLIGIILVAVGAGLLIWALTGRDANAPMPESNNNASVNTAQTDSENPDQSTSSEDQAQAAVITFTNDGFTPSSLTVKKGATVTVKNESSNRVQFSSDDHPTHRLNTEMNLRTLAPGELASFTATTVGAHGFHDHIDDSKVGTLTVTE